MVRKYFLVSVLFLLQFSTSKCQQDYLDMTNRRNRTATVDETLSTLFLRRVENSHIFVQDVIDATLFKIRQSNIFRDSVLFFLNRISGEAHYCLMGDPDFTSYYLCDGVLQITPTQFASTKDIFWHEELREVHQAIANYSGWGTFISWPEVTFADLTKPLYAGIAMCIFSTVQNADEPRNWYSGLIKIRPNISHLSAVKLRAKVPELFHANLDVVFLVDATNSGDTLEVHLNMVPSLMTMMDITSVDTRMGMVAYDKTETAIIFPLTNISVPCYNRRSYRVSKEVMKLRQRVDKYESRRRNASSSTVTADNSSVILPRFPKLSDGLQTSIKMLRLNKLPERASKSLVYILAMGSTEHFQEDLNATIKAANEARENGISILVTLIQYEKSNDTEHLESKLLDIVGEGNNHLMVLKRSESQYYEMRYDVIRDFGYVPVQILERDAPEGQEIVQICRGKLGESEKEYFKYHFLSSEMGVDLIVNLTLIPDGSVVTQKIGKTKILRGFYSYTFPLPSSAVFDGVIDTLDSRVRIPANNSANSKFVYISLSTVDLDDEDDEILAYKLEFLRFIENGESEGSTFVFVLKFFTAILIFVLGVLAIIFIVKILQARKIISSQQDSDAVSYSSENNGADFRRL